MPDTAGTSRPEVTIVTPAFNEAGNLTEQYRRLRDVLERQRLAWEWVIVDDHSKDETFALLKSLADQDGRIRGFRLSRNFGSHTAIMCGLHRAAGRCAIVIAGDLQDPPETIPGLIETWRRGAQVVWAVRERREGTGVVYLAFARLYWALLRRIGALADTPATGADFFLLDRRAIEALGGFRESNASVLSLITWIGFRQAQVRYDRQARWAGRSGWSLRKRLKLIVDSLTSFTYFPIRLMSYVGFITALLGFLYALVVVYSALRGYPPQGWAALMIVILVIGGIQMIMLGVLGEYIWRALDESRHRPRYIIEADVGAPPEPRLERAPGVGRMSDEP